MIGTWVTRALMYVFILLAFIAALEKDLPRVKYWAGSALLTWGVLTM